MKYRNCLLEIISIINDFSKEGINPSITSVFKKNSATYSHAFEVVKYLESKKVISIEKVGRTNVIRVLCKSFFVRVGGVYVLLSDRGFM